MKENLKVLLQSLRGEQSTLEKEKRDLSSQYRSLTDSRRKAARNCLSKLLPDLMPRTIQTLQNEVPGFRIPTVSTWFGFNKKIDPGVSLDTLRMQLGAYIDNSSGALPKIWKEEVSSTDGLIRNLQENLIRSNANRITDINTRIAALEKLLSVDISKMSPKVRKRIEQAVTSQAKTIRSSPRSRRYTQNIAPAKTAYPSSTQINSDSGPSLLEMWFWYELLTSHSECSHEVERIEGGGGSFGGGGANGNWDDQTSTATPNDTPSSSIPSEDAELAIQAGLGSQSFS